MPRCTALPTETTDVSGSARALALSMNSSASAPDCEMKANPLLAPAAAPGGRSRRKVAAKRQAGSRWMMPAQLGPATATARSAASFSKASLRATPTGPASAKPPGRMQEIADVAVGTFADGVEDGVGPDDDHGKVDRRIDGGDRGHRLVTEYRAALGIDRHDPSAITGLAQQLHDGAARRRGALAGADHGDAAGREERREVAGGIAHGASLQHRRRGRTRWPIRSSFSSKAAPTSSGRASRCAACCPAPSAAWSGRSSSSTISGRWSCRRAATAWRCGRIRISAWRRSPTCSTAASSIATAWAMRRRSGRATSTG